MTPDDLYAIADDAPRLSMRAEMSLWDINGRCRCPGCGKYRKRSDIPDQQTTACGGGMIISLLPVCRTCLDSQRWERD